MRSDGVYDRNPEATGSQMGCQPGGAGSYPTRIKAGIIKSEKKQQAVQHQTDCGSRTGSP